MSEIMNERAGRALAAWELGLGDGDDDARFGEAGAAERHAELDVIWPDKVERALAIYAAGRDATTPTVEGGDRVDAYDAIAAAIGGEHSKEAN